MSYRLLFLIGFALLLFSPNSSLHFNSTYERREEGGANLPFTPLARAYLTGDKKGLSRKIIKHHKNLNLMHLMTPSGLHLSSLLIMTSPIVRTPVLKSLFLSLLFISCYPLVGLDSFIRMILFTILRLNPIKKYSFTDGL